MIAKEDIEALALLLKSGMPLKEAFDLLQSEKNRKVFTEIEKQLQEGKLIEELLPQYLKADFRSYLQPLLKLLPFAKALDLSLRFEKKNKELRKSLSKDLFYPLVLLFVALSALYLFDLYGFDLISDLLTSLHSDLGILKILRLVFRIFIRFFYLAFLLIVAFIAFCFRPKRLAATYLVLARWLSGSLFQLYHCIFFVRLLLLCFADGYHSKESLAILKQLETQPLIALFAAHLDERLQEGESLKEAFVFPYFDPVLANFIKVGIAGNSLNEMLEKYQEFAELRFSERVRRYTLSLQLLIYLLIGGVIIFIYLVLFSPLRALNSG